MTELHQLTATEQLSLIERGEASPSDLLAASYSRIDALNDSVAAFVHIADRSEIQGATSTSAGRFPVPVSVKDLTLTRGMPTQFGSLVTKGFVPTVDADVVDAMRSAGLLIVGKTGTSEFGSSICCEGRLFPPVRNPWNPEREASGGSSGGAAASVATGMVPWAQGSDGGGSNRVPAALCGIYGYKPSRGVVSHGPFNSPMFGFPSNGPLARCVRDIQLLTAIMSKTYPGEPYFNPVEQRDLFEDWKQDAGSYQVRNKRVICTKEPIFADVDLDPVIRAEYEATRDALDRLGCRVTEIERPLIDTPGLGDLFGSLQSVMAGYPVSDHEANLLTPLSQHLRDMSAAVSGKAVLQLWSALQDASRRALRSLTEYDFILTPVTSRPSLQLYEFQDLRSADRLVAERDFSPFTQAATLTGQPALSAPVWSERFDRPVGMMVSSHLGNDRDLLRFARRLEELGVLTCRLPPDDAGSARPDRLPD